MELLNQEKTKVLGTAMLQKQMYTDVYYISLYKLDLST